MIKIQTIQLKAFLILLVYIVSNIPVSLFHSHENGKVTLEQATACEKKIYFGNVDGDCEHSTHISKAVKKCSSCDQQLATPHIVATISNTLQKLLYSKVYTPAIDNCIIFNPSTCSNKGPPANI